MARIEVLDHDDRRREVGRQRREHLAQGLEPPAEVAMAITSKVERSGVGKLLLLPGLSEPAR